MPTFSSSLTLRIPVDVTMGPTAAPLYYTDREAPMDNGITNTVTGALTVALKMYGSHIASGTCDKCGTDFSKGSKLKNNGVVCGELYDCYAWTNLHHFQCIFAL